jgi:hypothetical protein
MGGYDSSRGNAHNVIVVQNTTCSGTGGEIVLQYNCDGITIKNNILVASSGQRYISNDGGNNTNVLVDNNLYFGASLVSPGSYADAHARFVNPLLVNPLVDLHLLLGSPAINAGIGLGNDPQGQPLSGGSDIDVNPRVQGTGVDIGANEFGIGTTDVPAEAAAGNAFSLIGVGPNPVMGPVRIAFSLGHAALIRIEVLDVLGRRVASPAQGVWPAGTHALSWDRQTWHGEPAPAGAYFVRYVHPGGQDVLRVVLAR